MFNKRKKIKAEYRARVEGIIRRDRAAIIIQRQLDIMEMERKINKPEEKWDYSLFRKVIGVGSKKVQNWFQGW